MKKTSTKSTARKTGRKRGRPPGSGITSRGRKKASTISKATRGRPRKPGRPRKS